MAPGEIHSKAPDWSSLLQPGAAAMQLLQPGLFGSGSPDPAVLAAAYAQLQQQHPQFMGHGMQPRHLSNRPYPPDRSGVKKCGHCQSMKPCVEFSADTSRGDGLRGWCKLCEAEARSTRYKKRKAAAQAAAAARRRFEMPLGGVFWNGGEDGGGQLPPPFNGAANMDPAVQQQLLAMLAYQQQLQLQQQQQQKQRQGGSGSRHESGHGALAHRTGGSLLQGLSGGADAVKAAAFAAAAAGAGAMHGGGSGGSSPSTSDSENSAMERFKKQRVGSGGNSPGSMHPPAWGQDATAAVMRRPSTASDDSVAALTLAYGPQAALNPSPFLAVTAQAAQRQQQLQPLVALSHMLPPGAPLPPTEVHIPKRSRTRYAASAAEAAATRPPARGSTKTAAAAAAGGSTPAGQQPQSEVVQWASQMMATLLLLRAKEFAGGSSPKAANKAAAKERQTPSAGKREALSAPGLAAPAAAPSAAVPAAKTKAAVSAAVPNRGAVQQAAQDKARFTEEKPPHDE